MSAGSPVRVVIIDRDAQLLARLEAELTRAGMVVESLSSTLGLTPELLALSAPDVVLLDLGLPGLPIDVVPAIFTDLRKRRRLRCMVIGEGTPEELAKRAAQLGADAAVSRANLEAAGARALKESTAPAIAKKPVVDPLSDVPDAGAVAQARLRAKAPAPVTTIAADISSLIEDELLKAPPAPLNPGVARFQVALDLFSEHQLFISKGNTLEGGGIFISTALPPAVGTEVVLEITVFRRVKAELKAKVMWATPPRVSNKQPSGAGVVLIDKMPDDMRKSLSRLLEERRPITWTPRP